MFLAEQGFQVVPNEQGQESKEDLLLSEKAWSGAGAPLSLSEEDRDGSAWISGTMQDRDAGRLAAKT